MLLLHVSINSNAATYYSTAGGTLNPNTLTFWKTARNGTGASPANFTSGDIFVVQGSGNGGSTSASNNNQYRIGQFQEPVQSFK